MNWPFWSPRRPASSEAQSESCDGIEPLLSLYADGMAAPEESRRVAAHLATCADCRESLAWMQATHRALASRPMVAPPANLQARIAEAIAASSAAPIRLAPTHAFSLRPAYAAAASLTVLGIVLSISLLNHPAPSTLTARPVTPPLVAVNPLATLKSPASHDHAVVARGNTPPRVTVHPITHHEEPGAIAVVPTPKRFPASPPQRNTQLALVTKAPVVNPQRRLKPSTALFASTHFVPTEHKQPSVTPPQIIPPKINPPVEVAVVPKSPPSVPFNIRPATVTTQTETQRIQLASDMKGNVYASIDRMSHEGYATIMKSASHAALNLRENNISDAATLPITYGSLSK